LNRGNKYYSTAAERSDRLSLRGVIADTLELVKIRITLLVAFTTALGYILATDSLSLDLIYPVLGIFVLACSSAALNQYQERKYDGMMARTMGRPLPAGRISGANALLISGALFVTGSLILYSGANLTTLTIGYVTFVCYNFIYTPLKRKFALAIIPGSLVGALPPVAGWAAAGGSLTDEKILLVAAFFFMWQIPHFWLLLMKYGKQYEGAGFPSLTAKLSKKNLAMMVFYTTIMTVIPAGIYVFAGLLNYTVAEVLLLAASVWLIISSYKFTRSELNNKNITNSFIGINVYTLLFITLLSLDKLINLI
jgi:heme o synthase